MNKDKYRDPFAPHVSEGETEEDAAAEVERIKREQLEWELMQQTEKFNSRVKRKSETE